MIAVKNQSAFRIIGWTFHHLVWISLWVSIVTVLYYYTDLKEIELPWLPISVMGTAVAFYLGFKNNSAYDRMWEARKIWGAIINSSRAWGMYIDGFVSDHFCEDSKTNEEIQQVKKRLIYRHIAWLYALRSQLLVITPWEHANQKGMIGVYGRKIRKKFGVGLVDDEVTKVELNHYLPQTEYERLINHKNTATQIVNEQSRDLASIRKENIIDDFKHMELEKVLYDFYVHQGKCERIKKFPLPRQYANMSQYFVGIFIFCLPFAMSSLFYHLHPSGVWFSIPLSILVCWIYMVMEIVGDYSENPFQGMASDIPMLSLCRTIEIDLREMLGETELPEPIKSKNGILM